MHNPAIIASGCEKAWERCGDVQRVGRGGKFVGDSVDFPIFLCSLDDSVDKTRSVRSEHPGDAHDEVPIFHGEHILLSSQLRFAVDADRLRFIFFDVRCAFLSLEDIVGAEVNQLRAFFAANPRKNARHFGVNQKGAIPLGLAKIDISECGSIDQHIQICHAQSFAHIVQIR